MKYASETEAIAAAALAYPDVFGMEIYGYAPAAHHEEWLEAAEQYDRLAIIAPPESAKTMWTSILMSQQIARAPYSTNAIICIGAKKAQERLGVVKNVIEHDAKFNTYFPHIQKGDKWTDSEITVSVDGLDARRVRKSPDATLFAAGVGSHQVNGARYNGLVLLDDIIDQETSRTQTQRDKTAFWLQSVLLQRMMEGGRVILIGTPWHSQDILHLVKNLDGWHIVETPAIKDGKSYWASQWSMERLNKKKREMTDALWDALYLLKPSGLAGSVFETDWIKPADSLSTYAYISLGVDLAISQSDRAAYTVVATVGIDHQRRYTLLDIRRGRWTFHEQKQQIINAANDAYRFYRRVDALGVEDVAYQKAMIQELERETALPVVSVPKRLDKRAAAYPLAVAAENGDFYALKQAAWFAAFEAEFTDYPEGSFLDQVDATLIAMGAENMGGVGSS